MASGIAKIGLPAALGFSEDADLDDDDSAGGTNASTGDSKGKCYGHPSFQPTDCGIAAAAKKVAPLIASKKVPVYLSDMKMLS